MYFKLQKFMSRKNLVNQRAAVFCVRNALKVTYEHLRFENFFRGLYPGPSLKGEGGHEGGKGGVERRGPEGREMEGGVARRGMEGREGIRRGGNIDRGVPPRFKLVSTASLVGLATALHGREEGKGCL
jgi:hypothetical protein